MKLLFALVLAVILVAPGYAADLQIAVPQTAIHLPRVQIQIGPTQLPQQVLEQEETSPLDLLQQLQKEAKALPLIEKCA